MKIIPSYDMLIAGQHAPAGKPFEVSDEKTALGLIAQRIATRFTDDQTHAVAEPVHTATLKAPQENAARKRR